MTYPFKSEKIPIEHFYYEHPQGGLVPLILFVHGLSGCVEQWEKPMRHMMETANVLAVNLPASGHSCNGADLYLLISSTIYTEETDVCALDQSYTQHHRSCRCSLLF